VWTVYEGEAMYRLVGLGAHGITTDYPGRLQQVLAALEGRSLAQVVY